MRRHRILALAAAVAVAVSLNAQQPPVPAPSQAPPEVTFQAEITYVDVDASVTDAQGNFISNLSKDDFEILEDGKPQKIETFSLVNIPLERQERFRLLDRPVRSDVKSNRRPFDGRLYVIVMDDYDVSPIRTPMVIRTAREFVEKYFGANDVGSVIYTSGRTDAMQDFTNDPQLLIAAINKFVGRRLRSAVLEKLDTYYQQKILSESMTAQDTSTSSETPQNTDIGGHSRLDPMDFERTYRATSVLSTLKNLSEYLEGVRGRRKSLLLFSEGIDYMVTDPFNNPGAPEIIRGTQDAVNAAARANVNFFTFDPRGLVGMTAEWMGMQGSGAPELLGDKGPAMTGLGITGGSGLPINGQVDIMEELRLSQDSLRTLAEETGGIAAVNRNTTTPIFEKIVEAGSRYYLMGYYPPTHPRDGRFHKIQVRVKRPGMTVVARKGYASPRGKTAEERKQDDEARRARDAKKPLADKTSTQLRDVLSNPLQQSGLTLSVQAAPFRNSGSKKEASVALAIEVDGSRLQFTPAANGLLANQLELSMFDLTEQGKAQVGIRSMVDLTLRPETARRVTAAGVRANPRMVLAPGRYQLRIGAREAVGGLSGTVFVDLQVPDFTKDSLMLSGLLLTSATAQLTPTPQPDPAVAKLLPAPATSRREFARGDILALLAEIYDNSDSDQARSIDVVVRLLGEDGIEVFTAKDTLSNTGAKDPKHWDAYSYTKEFPLKDVAPGRYLLRVESQVRGNTKLKPAAETLLTVLSP